MKEEKNNNDKQERLGTEESDNLNENSDTKEARNKKE